MEKDKSINNIFRDNLNYYMTKKDVTQVELAEKLSVSAAAVNKWTKGTSIPRMNKIHKICHILGVQRSELLQPRQAPQSAIDAGIATNKGAVRIPVLSEIAAGVPIEAMNYTLDDADPATWEEIPAEWLHGDKQYFALRVSGDSMEPKIEDGTIAIIERCYEFIDNRIMAVYINGYNATLKRVRLKDNGMIVLEAFNPTYGAQIFTAEETETLPVRPCGILRETRTTW